MPRLRALSRGKHRRRRAGHELHARRDERRGGHRAVPRPPRASIRDLPILLLTAWTSLETAVQLVKEGASDYLAKPWDDDEAGARRSATSSSCARCASENARRDAAARRASARARYDLRGIVYESEAMHRVVVARAAGRAVRCAGADHGAERRRAKRRSRRSSTRTRAAARSRS